MRKLGLLTAAVTLALGFAFSVVGVGSAGAFQAYSISGGSLPGNQDWTGALGLDFDVISPITITSLGVFDDDRDGIAGSIDVHIFDLNGDLSTPLASATITGGGDPLTGEFRFKDITPLILAPGNYSVVAFGFDGTDLNGNENPGNIPLVTDGGGGLITFAASRFGDQPVDPLTTFPTHIDAGCDGHPEYCYAAGSFIYAAAGFSLDVEKTLLDGPDELGTIGIGLEETQPFVFEIVIENTGGEEAADGAVVYDVVPAEYNLDPDAEDDAFEAPAPDNSCEDTDCNGVASDDEARCVVTPSQAPGASKGKQPKKAPEFLTIEILDLGAGETCTVTVWVTTDQNYGNHDPVIYEPTSCHYFFPGTGGDVPILDEFGVPMHDWIALNDGFKVFSPEDGALVEGPADSIQLDPLCDFDDDEVVDELDDCPLEGLEVTGFVDEDGCPFIPE